ncbi:hypothetical protein EDL96_10945 [Kocuria soli]|uniref:Uncharacterized protein n=1 Tax=Kocuria soli TaxID=2485125 RepID=A0A3N3ZPX4_9MICC|nr:hypothetical protein EDL96_10945 [Kocuria soli]
MGSVRVGQDHGVQRHDPCEEVTVFEALVQVENTPVCGRRLRVELGPQGFDEWVLGRGAVGEDPEAHLLRA